MDGASAGSLNSDPKQIVSSTSTGIGGSVGIMVGRRYAPVRTELQVVSLLRSNFLYDMPWIACRS